MKKRLCTKVDVNAACRSSDNDRVHGGTVTLRAAETTNWVGDEGLSGTADAPEPDKVVPDANQFRYQKEELAAFCHFGPNTFNEIEWGEHYGDKAPSEIF